VRFNLELHAYWRSTRISRSLDILMCEDQNVEFLSLLNVEL
jgi:hypothetical protein